jgi:hypothetical protein
VTAPTFVANFRIIRKEYFTRFLLQPPREFKGERGFPVLPDTVLASSRQVQRKVPDTSPATTDEDGMRCASPPEGPARFRHCPFAACRAPMNPPSPSPVNNKAQVSGAGKCLQSEQGLIRGVHDRISRRRIGVKRPGIHRLIRVIMLVGVGGAVRGALEIICCHKTSSGMVDGIIARLLAGQSNDTPGGELFRTLANDVNSPGNPRDYARLTFPCRVCASIQHAYCSRGALVCGSKELRHPARLRDSLR